MARQGGLTPDRVWARRAARRTVAFDCSHQTTGAGGESGQGWGRRRVHMPTPPNQGCPRATLWPPIAPPAQLPLHQRAWSSSPAPKCRGLEGVWLHRRVRQRPAELFMRPLSLATLHPAPCTSPMHFDQQPPKLPTFSAHSIQGNPKICSKYGDLWSHNAQGAGF